jgi:hypothetical protein
VLAAATLFWLARVRAALNTNAARPIGCSAAPCLPAWCRTSSNNLVRRERPNRSLVKRSRKTACRGWEMRGIPSHPAMPFISERSRVRPGDFCRGHGSPALSSPWRHWLQAGCYCSRTIRRTFSPAGESACCSTRLRTGSFVPSNDDWRRAIDRRRRGRPVEAQANLLPLGVLLSRWANLRQM